MREVFEGRLLHDSARNEGHRLCGGVGAGALRILVLVGRIAPRRGARHGAPNAGPCCPLMRISTVVPLPATWMRGWHQHRGATTRCMGAWPCAHRAERPVSSGSAFTLTVKARCASNFVPQPRSRAFVLCAPECHPFTSRVQQQLLWAAIQRAVNIREATRKQKLSVTLSNKFVVKVWN